jgi:gliding motility-associated-like protein
VLVPVNRTIKIYLPFIGKTLICLLALTFSFLCIHAQNCPPNLDFEKGDFSGWTCYTGSVSAAGNVNTISLNSSGGPVPDQHTIYSAANDAGLRDYFGDFPVLCPNGSKYSVKLGNTSGEAQAEGLSYEFTIPANRNTYSLIYHYAVVFQDPSHLEFQQPRLELEVKNVTDNELISCSSFTFFPNGSPLPGFFLSQLTGSVPTPVWCKDWSAVTINLNEKAGKTIRLLFKTADCTFRRHFGYAYIDVNSECSSEFTGASYCPDDTAVSVTAPYGYQNYKWFNNTFTQVLGTQQILNLSPPPPPGTTLAVELIPYDGYGCLDTLYANMIDTLSLIADAGPDVISCNNKQVFIGALPVPGVTYSWNPASGLSDPLIANPKANPSGTTPYELTIRNSGGGCISKDEVIVTDSFVDSSLQLAGKSLFCINTGDSAVLTVQPTNNMQWFRNGNLIAGANQKSFKINQSGSYYAALANKDGCSTITRVEEIVIESPRPGITYPIQYAIVNIPLELQARTFGVSLLWEPSSYLNNPAIPTPLFTASVVLEQLYSISIKNAAGCVTKDAQLVRAIKEVKVYVPTAFTPNNNGLNDYIKPIMLGIKELKYFRIYNRGGQLVYEHNSNQPGWDGKIGGLDQSTGVYVWMFQGIGWDKRTHTQNGTVTLIR